MFISRTKVQSMYNEAVCELNHGNTYGARRILEKMKDARRSAFLWTTTDKRYSDRLISNLEKEIDRKVASYRRSNIVIEPINMDGKTFILTVVFLCVVGIIAGLIKD